MGALTPPLTSSVFLGKSGHLPESPFLCLENGVKRMLNIPGYCEAHVTAYPNPLAECLAWSWCSVNGISWGAGTPLCTGAHGAVAEYQASTTWTLPTEGSSNTPGPGRPTQNRNSSLSRNFALWQEIYVIILILNSNWVYCRIKKTNSDELKIVFKQ